MKNIGTGQLQNLGLAIEVPGENTSNEWCEKVSDEEYNNLPE